MNTPLDYRPPDRGQSGCESLFLQTLAGLFIAFFNFLVSYSIARSLRPNSAFFLVFAIGSVVALVPTSYLAYRRQPGYLIGFLIGSSVAALLASACGNFF